MWRWKKIALFSCLITVIGLVNLQTAQAAQDDYSEIYAYVSGGLMHWNSDDSSAEGLKLSFGQQLNTFIGAEMQFGLGGEDKNTEVSLERLFGIYAKFSLPLDKLHLYAKVGMTNVSVKAAEETASDFGISYGGGVQMHFTPNVYADLEFMSYLDTAEVEFEGFTLSLGYKIP